MNDRDLHSMLHPYLDGELGATETAAFEAHLLHCDECREELRVNRELRANLKTAFPPAKAPASLHTDIRSGLNHEVSTEARTTFLSWRSLAVAASIAVAILSLWMFTHRGSPLDAEALEAQQFIDNHTRAIASEKFVELSSGEREMVQPWISTRMGFSASVADLTSAGFTLVGSRVETVANKHAAVVVYRIQGHLVDVFEFPRGTHISDDVHHWDRSGYRVVSFCRGALRYWVVGDPSQGDMTRLVDRLRES